MSAQQSSDLHVTSHDFPPLTRVIGYSLYHNSYLIIVVQKWRAERLAETGVNAWTCCPTLVQDRN